MQIILDIGAVLVFIMAVVAVPRAVWKGNPGPHAGLLAGFVACLVIIFGLVSMSVATGLAATSSSTSQIVLLIGIIVVAILCGVTWSPARTSALPGTPSARPPVA